MALRSTPTLSANTPAPAAEQTEPKALLPERFKAYCDAPDGITKNKYFTYQTHDIDHSINLMMRLVESGWKVRAAYHQFADGRSVKVSDQARKAGLINANK